MALHALGVVDGGAPDPADLLEEQGAFLTGDCGFLFFVFRVKKVTLGRKSRVMLWRVLSRVAGASGRLFVHRLPRRFASVALRVQRRLLHQSRFGCACTERQRCSVMCRYPYHLRVDMMWLPPSVLNIILSRLRQVIAFDAPFDLHLHEHWLLSNDSSVWFFVHRAVK